MTPRLAALVATLALAGGCGDSSAKPAASVADVKGEPLRREPATPLAPDAAAVGDLSGSPTALPPTEPPAAAPAAPPPTANVSTDGFQTVTFEELSGFDYALYAEESKTKHEIPAKIAALSGKKIAVDGYMAPIQYEAGGAKKFILMKSQMGCCYGGTPKLNEWVEVTMEGGAVAEYEHQALITAWGVLEVKPESRDGMATSLYKMRGVKTEFTEAK